MKEFTQARQAFEYRRERLAAELREARGAGAPVRLKKRTSNLFRQRADSGARELEVAGLDSVLSVDPASELAEVGGMTTYESFVAATLPLGLMPAVVPELKTITVGGAVTGGGIESSSFRYGFVHETVEELEILTASGDLVVCGPENAHSDLFFGFPNSYGTLGYALRLRVRLVPVRPFVFLEHRRYSDAGDYFREMEKHCLEERGKEDGAPFIDGTVFGEGELYQTTGRWADTVAETSDYTFMRPYYRSIRERTTDALAVAHYIWRWDTDWFWCARALGMENPVLRFATWLCGGLQSKTYWKLRNWNERTGLLRKLRLQPDLEWVIQDVEIPAANAEAFFRFFQKEIGIRPVWICPAMAYRRGRRFPLYQTNPETLYINFGFWGGVPEKAGAPGYHNRLVEQKVAELGGKKSLYSSSFFTEAEFWKEYNESAYRTLKERYDPGDLLPDLYARCVRGR